MHKVSTIGQIMAFVVGFVILTCAAVSAQFGGDLMIGMGRDTLNGTIKVSGDYYRMDVAQGGQELFIIVDQKNKVTRVFDIASKQYREMKSQDITSLMNDPFQSVIYTRTMSEETSMGAETVAGFECDKYKYAMDGQDVMIVWKAKDLNFPIKIENLANIGYAAEITNIKQGEIDKTLFALPADYTLFEEKQATDEATDIDIVDAAGMGNVEVIKKHIANGVDVNYDKGDGYTPLLMASMYGKTDAVKYLIEAGADVNLVNKDGSSAILAASQYGKLDIVKMLVAAGADVNAEYGKGYTSLLREAIQYGHVDVAKFLIESGADIKFKNTSGKGLIDAANKNDAAMMEMLKAAAVE